MRKIREALRLRASGLTTREVGDSIGVGRTSVSTYLTRAQRAGLSWPLPEGLTDTELEALLFPAPPPDAASVYPRPDWPHVHRELRRPGVTLSLLWEEYREAHPKGYGYSRFCELFRRWEGKLAPVMRQHHVAGGAPYVDYAGATFEIVTPATGELREAQFFVAALGGLEPDLCRGELDPGLARLDRRPCPGLRLLRRRAEHGGVGQSQGRGDQGLFPRAADQPDLCRDGGALRHRGHPRPPAQAP